MNNKILERLQELVEDYENSINSEERLEIGREIMMLGKMIKHNAEYEKNTNHCFHIHVFLDDNLSN